MRKKIYLPPLIYLTAMVFAFSGGVMCAKNADHSDDDSDDSDATPVDDTISGDDSEADDDSAGDDSSLDDDSNTGSPIITDAAWVPAAFTWDPSCGDQNAEPCTNLVWHICDRDNDMLPDGVIYIYQHPPSSWEPWINVSDFFLPPGTDFSDCNAPVEFHIGLLVTEDQFQAPGTFEVIVEIEATDSAGNLSNKIENVTLSVTYDG